MNNLNDGGEYYSACEADQSSTLSLVRVMRSEEHPNRMILTVKVDPIFESYSQLAFSWAMVSHKVPQVSQNDTTAVSYTHLTLPTICSV